MNNIDEFAELDTLSVMYNNDEFAEEHFGNNPLDFLVQ